MYNITLQLSQQLLNYIEWQQFEPEEFEVNVAEKTVTFKFKSAIDIWDTARSFENNLYNR